MKAVGKPSETMGGSGEMNLIKKSSFFIYHFSVIRVNNFPVSSSWAAARFLVDFENKQRGKTEKSSALNIYLERVLRKKMGNLIYVVISLFISNCVINQVNWRTPIRTLEGYRHTNQMENAPWIIINEMKRKTYSSFAVKLEFQLQKRHKISSISFFFDLTSYD